MACVGWPGVPDTVPCQVPAEEMRRIWKASAAAACRIGNKTCCQVSSLATRTAGFRPRDAHMSLEINKERLELVSDQLDCCSQYVVFRSRNNVLPHLFVIALTAATWPNMSSRPLTSTFEHNSKKNERGESLQIWLGQQTLRKHCEHTQDGFLQPGQVKHGAQTTRLRPTSWVGCDTA